MYAIAYVGAGVGEAEGVEGERDQESNSFDSIISLPNAFLFVKETSNQRALYLFIFLLPPSSPFLSPGLLVSLAGSMTSDSRLNLCVFTNPFPLSTVCVHGAHRHPVLPLSYLVLTHLFAPSHSMIMRVPDREVRAPASASDSSPCPLSPPV